jgi:hypothetical protein
MYLFMEKKQLIKWTLENLQIQFVKDQMEFYESDNLHE